MSAYGWTIEDVDNLTVRQMVALLKEIKKYPPTNVLLAEFIKGIGSSGKGLNTLDIDKQLSKIPHSVKKDGVEDVKKVFSKSGNRILKIIDKKTGKRII